MDLNGHEELCKSDFFDFVLTKREGEEESSSPGENSSYLDPMDYNTDPNNNSVLSSNAPSHIKSFLDEILLAGDPLAHHHQGGPIELLGTFTWATSPHSTPLLSSVDPLGSSGGDDGWEPPSGGMSEVTTLTNLLDPLFVSFEEETNPHIIKMDSSFYPSDHIINSSSSATVISSDLITSTFLSESSDCPTTPPPTSLTEAQLITWHNNNNSSNKEGLHQEDSSSLLRTALQSKQTGDNNNNNNISNNNAELRKVLSFPPLRGSDGVEGTSPDGGQHVIISTSSSSDSPYYELKVLDSVFLDPDALIPNQVEELVLTRISPYSPLLHQPNQLENKEEKVNSTTSTNNNGFTTKWTYINPPSKSNNNNNNSSNSSKVPRRRSKKPTSANSNVKKEDKEDEGDDGEGGNSRGEGSESAASRKERSLHYCTICSKGFKDKYSVNVHVRTHTGEKPFSCTLCGKNFRQKAHLAKHYQTHAAKANGTNSHLKGSTKHRNNTQSSS